MQKVAESKHTPFMSHLATVEPDALFEAERAVSALVDSPGWKVVMDLLGKGRQSVEARLKYSKPRDSAAEYAQILGQVVGMEAAEAAAEAVLIKAAERQRKLEAQMGVEA